MVDEPVRGARLASLGDSLSVGGDGGGVRLWNISVNTAAASSVVTVYQTNPSLSSSKLAVVDAASKSQSFYGGITCMKGMQVYLTGGNADVTISYS